jgi:transposase
LREQRSRLSNSSSVAKPIDYVLRRFDRFARFTDDGRICLTNNAAERALRGFATHESLCPLSSSVCKHWKRIGVGNATRATFSGHRSFYLLRRQVIGTYLIRRSWNDLYSRKDAGLDKATYRVVCDA